MIWKCRLSYEDFFVFFFSEAFVHVLCLVAEKEKKIEGNENEKSDHAFLF